MAHGDDGHDHDHDHVHDHGPPGHDGHDHPHEHEYGHEHGHDHPHHHHGHAASTWRADLPAGAGKGRLLFLDAPSGLAGDMIISALVDLGVPGAVVAEAAARLPLTGYHLHFGTKVRSGIVATHFDVHVDAAQPERTWGEIREILAHADLPAPVLGRALATFERLARSEAKVHRMPIDDVHFHEVGAIDAIVDIVGSAAALEHLGAELVVSPLPMGRGFVDARHGRLPLPAPATVECLAGLATYDGGIDFEFVTPTGAAIVGAHARRSERWPSLSPERVGWGSGTANLRDRPNLLRAVLGTPADSATAGESGESPKPTHTVLEANLDDATGELVAACIASLLEAGALDAWAQPVTMKKGRPAFVLSAIARIADANRLAAQLLAESTSLGVRRHDVSRIERPRRMIAVDTRFGRLAVKVAEGAYGPPQVKPELDDCLAAARRHGVPLREVLREAQRAAEDTLAPPSPGLPHGGSVLDMLPDKSR
jgi:uncharacterized protein (TIGR00299 family) protein